MQPIPAGFPIEKLCVPLIVGYLLHWGLFGALSVQVYLYYLAFPKDKKFAKYLVYGIYIIEFVQTVLFTHDAFAEFGYGFGDIEALTAMNFNWLTVSIMSAVVSCIGQVFYAYRIFILSRSRIVPLFVICVSLTSAVAAMITGAYSFPKKSVTDLSTQKVSIAVGIWCGGSALCDIIIAICMTYYTFYGAPSLIIPQLYANAILMMLNSRIQIVGGRDTYTSSADMSITTTMAREIASQSTEGTQPADRIQGQVPVVVITQDVFSDRVGQTNEKLHRGSSISLSV
ncbi:hypothetical protein IW261DRAFT_1568816 [Armillaria novae-zelandiae]|uniref:Uncharacterized protein n=1 Tax=Armillaria novae-zelandiae TaxID=153914 RepID=A0AA39NYV9_9AGAR|nr:hypothetical protein IW261DRAFT_1568816 [Armillaria novae-zelandiae]